MIGTTVGKYRILERLGRGGMGIVYKALDETLDREVAIKVLNPDINDAELLKRFRAEAISLARLNHPGIATIYELHRQGDELLMVMEFVRGETLQALSERVGPLEPPQAAHICVQVLNALAHAHRAGIVHRDLKPANVMVSDTGVVKVMDFGIARMLGGEHFTHAGFMMGTPAYMAPEQVLGHEVDGRADLYSVGVLFYRLLTRELPFKADTAIAMAQKQVAEAPTPLGTFRPNLPAWCEPIISRALSKSVDDRFQTAEAFRSAILMSVTPAAMGDLPTMATPTPTGLSRTMPVLSGPDAPTIAATPSLADLGSSTPVSQGSPAVSATPVAASDTAGTPGSGVSAATERTGTTVVLGRSHLVTLAAVFVVLIAGIAALGYLAMKRGGNPFQSPASTPDASSPAADTAPADQPPADAAAGAGTSAPPAAPATEGTTPAPPPPATEKPTTDLTAAPRANDGTKKPKPAPASNAKPAATAPAPAPVSAEPTPAAPPAPAPAPEVPPVRFQDVKVLVTQGNTLRERDAVLSLGGDRLSVLDRDGTSELLSLPYTVIQQAFYSRSKEPKWKGPDGKERTADVDLGRMSFFRGERNWLIFITQGNPVFVRFEDANLQSVLAAVQQRSGITIRR
jgi:serine/threonine-protein kinase